MRPTSQKRRGVIFTGESVRAILAGQKTVTRRIIKAAPGRQSTFLTPALLGASPSARTIAYRGNVGAQFEHPKGGPLTWVRCPYGNVGDRLWVREGYAFMLERDPRTGERCEFARRVVKPDGCERFVAYRATAPEFEWCDGDGFATEGSGWRSPLMMPEWVSRIAIDVVDVRAERLHAIDDADAIREGVLTLDGVAGATTPRERFAALWDSINGGRASWASDPWIWRVSFSVASVAEGGTCV